MKIVIRAGGIGTRLWPFSRQSRPKQFHALAGPRTMLEEAVARVLPLVGMDEVFISTGLGLEDLVREQAPGLKADHLIVEPALRNTGPAVGLECALLEARFPGCTIASLGSDHHIGRPEAFCGLLQVAADALEDRPELLFAIGVKPTRVETGFGYIEKGEPIATVNGETVYAVATFKEKPDAAVARAYVESGRFLWNSNMFVWKARRMLDLFAQFEPEMHGLLAQIGQAAGTPDEAAAIREIFPKMKAIAIDHAVIERADTVATLEADIEWSDIGSWGALGDVISEDERGNILKGDVLALDARQVTVFGPKDKVIALVDVENLVVVDTGDALLICPRDGSQRVRDVVEALAARGDGRR